uniref:OSJNBb0033G08.9 protein n=1 Tax=Oryza sativa subsp. japonica TaxID=39947 RepID=Q7XSE5_ORYSJ|nr:OSJNBb0033G08.9 [Oryza sativa Japonica Group]
MEQPKIQNLSAPRVDLSEPSCSSKSILSDGYEIGPGFIAMIREQTFSGGIGENPYLHLWDFELVCSCLSIVGMTHETLKWKLFPFSLRDEAKQWYTLSVKKFHGEWEELKCKFCLAFFPLTRVINLRLDILSFRQNEKESLDAAWARFSLLTQSGPDLSLPDHVLLQHFRYGLDKESTANLDISAGGSFAHKTTKEGRELLDLILENNSFGRSEAILEVEVIHEDPLHVESEPDSTAKSSFQLLEPEEEEIHPPEIPFQFRDDLYEDYGNTLNYSSKMKAHPKHEPFEEVMFVSSFVSSKPIDHLHETERHSSLSIKPKPCPSGPHNVDLVYHQETTRFLHDAFLEKENF